MTKMVQRRRGETRLAMMAFLASAGVLVALVSVMGWDARRWFAAAEKPRPAVGKLARDVLKANGLWARFEKRVIVSKGTVNDVANDVATGAADAGIVWDVTVKQYADLEAVPVPLFAARRAHVSLGVLKTSE